MSYLQIDTIKYGPTPWEVANNTATTVGKLIEKLQQYHPDMPVVLKTETNTYGTVGVIKKIGDMI